MIRDHFGERYSRLIITRFSHLEKRNSHWFCKCDCGNTIVVRLSSLRNKNTQSCGCLQKEIATQHKINENKGRALPLGEAAKRSLYRIYIRNSKKRGVSFNLNFDEFIKLTNGNCYYCNVAPGQLHTKPDFNGSHQYNGIDRVDNNLGYTKINSVSCCSFCNRAKGVLSENEFLNRIAKIYYNKIIRA